MTACNHCEHECHCSHGGSCRTVECTCINCEHNPLDEFWKNLGEKDADVKSKKSYGKDKGKRVFYASINKGSVKCAEHSTKKVT